jgi:hypothetical protein
MFRQEVWLATTISLIACGGTRQRPINLDAPKDEQAMLGKLEGYLRCISDLVPNVFATADAYRASVGSQPPTLDTPLIVRPIDDPSSCLAGVMASQLASPPRVQLDVHGLAFADALVSVATLTRAAANNPSPGQRLELHGKLAAAFDTFDTTEAALFDDVERANHALHVSAIARKETKLGRVLVVLVDDIILRAEDVVRASATPIAHLDELDTTTLLANLAAFESAIEDATAYIADHPKEVEGPLLTVWVTIDHAKLLRVAATQLVTRAREHVAFSDSEKIMLSSNNEAGVVGTPGALADAYNNLLMTYSQ